MTLSPVVSNRLKISQQKLIEFCHHWRILEVALFRSVLREDFQKNSDIDLLISFAPEAPQGLLTLSRIRNQLRDIARVFC